MKLKYRITYNSLKLLSNLVQSLNPSKQYYYANKLGSICYQLLKIRQKEARKNIYIAFPKLSEKKRENILKDTYRFLYTVQCNFYHCQKVLHMEIFL